MKKITLLFLFTLSIVPQSSFSEDNHAEITRCVDPMSQREMDYCAGVKKKNTEETLKQLVIELKNTLEDEPMRHLSVSLKAWKTVIESDCAIASWYMSAGRESYMEITSCKTNHINQQIKSLSRYLCGSPLLSCPKKEKFQDYLSKVAH